jgi:hypothetical protein
MKFQVMTARGQPICFGCAHTFRTYTTSQLLDFIPILYPFFR